MSQTKPKVLVIDDTASIGQMMVRGLNASDCEAILAVGAAEGLRAATEFQPDIILSDIVMPEMNGLELLAKLQEDEATAKIPVVMLTSMSGKHDQEYSRSKGAVAYWIKDNVTPQTLGDDVRALLEKHQS